MQQTPGPELSPSWSPAQPLIVAFSTTGKSRAKPTPAILVPGLDLVSEAIHSSRGPTKEEITSVLNEEAHSYRIPNPAADGVTKYHTTRIASNSPVEDYLVHGHFSSRPGSSWYAWGVLDGHAGSQTAQLLATQLIPAVGRALSAAPLESSVSETIKNAFVELDDVIVQGALQAAVSDAPYQDRVTRLAQGYAGSCALLSLFDPTTRTLTACVGDSLAVLVQKGADGKWRATPLSVDQTGENEDEIARINAEHPGEEGTVKNGRVLGIMVSRDFGDGRHKWNPGFLEECKRNYDGFNPLSEEKYAVKTPPYLTVEPVITSTKIDDRRPSFLILATDGFWDRVSNEQAVSLVSQWLDWKKADSLLLQPAAQKSDAEYGPFELEKHRQGAVEFRFSEERTTLQDTNAAVHLVRNALDGNYHEIVSSTLAFGPPFARYIRDDITVQVVFFHSKETK
ncbi:phosphatase 2C-like domain-containing protein [Xylariales sp. AK1849]|nr:phosphatase 2C-like domain-containing protein [Xylariales sp. AK1849]